MNQTRSVAIESVVVGTRRRDDYGDIAGLARSLEQFGLLHPPVVDDQLRLVAGGRRLMAARQLGWQFIEVRNLGDLSEGELREIELEENLRRKDLTQAERSKTLLRLVEQATEVIREETEFLPTVGKNPKGGRPKKPDADERVAERIGVPRQTIDRARQHVAAVEKYPELSPVPQGDAIKIAKKLDEMPPVQREVVREAVKQNEPDTLAKLTDRPPLPNSPTPHERAANDPGVKFTKGFHDLVVRFNAMKNNGGIAAVVGPWRREVKESLLSDVIRIVDIATEWRYALERDLADVKSADEQGSVRPSDQNGVVGNDGRSSQAA